MNSKELEQAILNKLQSGEKMEDILNEVAATANKIDAELKAKNEASSKIMRIRKGPKTYIKDAQWDETEVNETVIGELLAAYILTDPSFAKDFDTDENILELIDICVRQIRTFPKIIGFAKHAANALLGKSDIRTIGASPSIHFEAKPSTKPDFDPIMAFLKENGL